MMVTGNAGSEALQRAAEALGRCEAVQKVAIADDPSGAGEAARAVATLRIDQTAEVHPSRPGPFGRQRSGSVRAEFRRPQHESTVTVQFIDKPWVADLAALLARQPAGQWVVAASDRPYTSAEGARERAIEIAAAKLAGKVGGAIRRADPGAWNRLRLGEEFSTGRVESRIAAELQRGNCVTDRFVQRFHRPYGDVWQQWLLVDSSAGRIDAVAISISQLRRDRWSALVRKALSVAGMAAAICVVYLFLNAATRGYYAWSLRVAAVVLAGAGAILLLMA